MKLFSLALAIFSLAAATFGQFSSSQIKNVQRLGDARGVVWTSTSVYKTDDSGATWSEISTGKLPSQTIAHVDFSNPKASFVLLADEDSSNLEIRLSADEGQTFQSVPIAIAAEKLQDVDLANAWLYRAHEWQLVIPTVTSSNFSGVLAYISNDLKTWKYFWRISRPNRGIDEVRPERQLGDWQLKQSGTCYGSKTACVQETRLFAGDHEITPPQIVSLLDAERQQALAEAARSKIFQLTPGGTTRVSLNRGFDQCNAPSVAQMQTWWNNSPHYNANIYMSGRARACSSQPNLNASWVNQVTAMGWGLIPTVVGYQAPCTTSSTTQRFSTDAATAEQQGRGEADIAVADAQNLGLTAGSILYYDLEKYNDPGDGSCSIPTKAFLKGWTDRIHELGYISGAYGSPANAQTDWVALPAGSKMDIIWMARWDNIASVWTYASFPNFPTNEWTDHQRIKQWQSPHNETWGGVTINIDGNALDAPVAGVAIARNKIADFDGDGKSDISVWRPDTGVWYAATSSNGSFIATQFGLSTDILAPGDYDGDGKTDEAVFRPSEGNWYILTKANVFTTRQFGTAGDIPVPADYNGDGKTDIAVFRPAEGVWYIANSDSQGTFTFIQFGVNGDKPVPADYDGDGKADVAVYRLNNGAEEWWLNRSSAGVFATVFGAAGDNAVEADYTGDGKADIAVFRPSTGTWYVLRSEDLSYFAFPFGTNGDIASPGDYDGDGNYDAAVFRPSTGIWYVQLSTGGFSIVGFGQQGDRSVPQAYLPQ